MKPEAQLQKAICDYLTVACPEILFFSITNGFMSGAKNKFSYMAHLKATGHKNGVPDMALYWPGGGHCFFEVKSPTGQLSKPQGYFHGKLASLGVAVFTIRSLEDVYQVIREFNLPCREVIKA